MAGTARPGVVPVFNPELGSGPFLPGTTVGKFLFSQWMNGQPTPHLNAEAIGAGGIYTDVPKTPDAPAAVVARPGNTFDNTPGHFFELIHVLPRTKVEFGNIITLVTAEYEIYNAYRETDHTLSAIINNASPGVLLPDVTPPLVVERQTSHLSPSSTGNTSGAGFGTLVKVTADAQPDGLPFFDTDIVFNFIDPANDPFLLVSGTRVVLMPFQYEAPATETLAFLTDVITTVNGKEQRIALRKNPRQGFSITYRLSENERQRMQALLFDWMDNLFGFPLWHEKLVLTAAVSPSATSYPVIGALDVDLRVGGLAVVISDSATFDVINIASFTDTVISANDPSINGYPAGTPIMPLRTAVIRKAVSASRSINNLETFRVEFETTDNNTGALAGDTTPGFWSTYNSRVLFDDCNVVNGDMSETFRRRIYVVDNDVGRIMLTSEWDRSKRNHEKGFVLRSRAEILEFRKVLLGLAGEQKAFYIPTFIEDLTVKVDLVLGTSTMDIVAMGYVRFANSRLPMSLFRITFTDGTSLVKTVISAAPVDASTERLTVDTTWPANRTVVEIRRVEFYELVRFNTDKFQINYPRIGLAECQTPVTRVFDDN